MSKSNHPNTNPLRAIEDFKKEVDLDQAEDRLSHWFQSAVDSDEGADKEDVNFFLSLLRLLKLMRKR